MANRLADVTVEDARLIFKNFAGEEDQYNRKGNRNFGVVLDPEDAREMEQLGWNVKWPKPRENAEEGDEPLKPHINVTAKYDGPRPPRIFMITNQGRKRTELDEELVDMLDYADIETVDLIFTPYHWSLPSGSSGIKAYLKTMYVHIRENELDIKYADIPDASELPTEEPDF